MTHDQKQNKSKKVKEIEVTGSLETRRGIFANHAIIYHQSEQFIIDFILLGQSDGTLNARVILTPSHFKRLSKAISENLKNYEEQHGEVSEEIG
jgi:hypothetical protein